MALNRSNSTDVDIHKVGYVIDRCVGHSVAMSIVSGTAVVAFLALCSQSSPPQFRYASETVSLALDIEH